MTPAAEPDPTASPGATPVPNAVVVVYAREGCHLCDQALEVIEAVRARAAFSLEVIDIDSDDALLARYLERIPVVSVNGEELFEFFVEDAAFSRAVGIVGAPGR